MPRKPKFDHPLRHIRKAANLTQEQFAKLLGISKDTIQSIENDRLKMSSELALKVRHQTGCSLSGEENKEGRTVYKISAYSPHTLKPYTAQDYNEHRELLRQFSEKDFEERVIAAVRCMDLLLRSASRQSNGTVLAILNDFEQFVSKSFETYHLDSHLNGLLRDTWNQIERAEIDLHVKTFPRAPLGTAWRFKAPFEQPGWPEEVVPK